MKDVIMIKLSSFFKRCFKMVQNISENEYLNLILGPRFLSFHVAMPLTIVYVLIFILGILGNAVTCVLTLSNSSLNSSINYYLTSLALSDITLLILGWYHNYIINF